MNEANPYRPPEADLGTPRQPGRHRPAVTVARVLVALWGLFILAGPSRTGPSNPAHHRGQIAAKAMGALLFVLAVFPFRGPRAKKAETFEAAAEDL